MSATFSIDVHGVVDTADELRSIHATLINSYDELLAKIRQFQETNAGESIDTYQQAAQAQGTVQVEMNQHLQKAAPLLQDIAEEHNATDLRSSSRFGGVPR